MDGRRTRRIATGVLIALVLAGLVGWLATSMHGEGGSSSSSGAATSAPGQATGGGAIAEPSRAPAFGSVPGSKAGYGTESNVPQIGPKIVKQASLRLSVKKGSFLDRYQQAIAVAGANGGYVESSETVVGRYRSGIITIRVPVDRFEAALAQLKGLGTVKVDRVSGQDVTSQYVDLSAQLRNWKAQEAVLLRLMAKAKTITDSIRVQQQLQNVQGTIQELQGQLQLLDSQTALSTISVSMVEAALVHPIPAKRPPLVQAWHDALDGFVNVIASVVVGLGYLIPIGLVAFVGWLGWRGIRRVRSGSDRKAPAAAAA